MGNYQFTQGELGRIFDNRREMTAFIKRAIDETLNHECPQRQKTFSED